MNKRTHGMQYLVSTGKCSRSKQQMLMLIRVSPIF